MNKLLRKINKFYRKYDITSLDEKVRLYIEDMYDLDSIRSAYYSICDSLQAYEDSTACKFMSDLYHDVYDHMFALENDLIKKPKYFADTIIKIVASAVGVVGFITFVAIDIINGCPGFYTFIGEALGIILAMSAGFAAYDDMKVRD